MRNRNYAVIWREVPTFSRSNYLGEVKDRDLGAVCLRRDLKLYDPQVRQRGPPTAAVLDRRSSSHDQADDEQNQEHHKQDPCDLSGRACDTAQAQDPGNQRDYQKSDRPV